MVCKHFLIVPDRNPELDHANRTLQAKCQRAFRRVFFGEVGSRSRYRRNRVHVATLSRQRAWMAVISHNGVSALLRDAPPISTHSDLKLYIVYGSTVICHMSWFYDMQIWWGFMPIRPLIPTIFAGTLLLIRFIHLKNAGCYFNCSLIWFH